MVIDAHAADVEGDERLIEAARHRDVVEQESPP
jgi:hypothetical protein